MAQRDPLVTAWFGVEIMGAIQGAFAECTGLGSENDVVEYKASAPDGKYVLMYAPGRMKYNKITLKRGITDAMDLWLWRKMVEEGKITQARKNGSIVMFNQEGKEIARWNIVNAWPSKLTGPTADAKSNQPGIEEMEIVFEDYRRKH